MAHVNDPPEDPLQAGTLDRVKRWLRGTSEVRELPLTSEAELALDRLRNKLIDMLSKAALVRAHRRRASAQDTTDLEAAFDELVNPPSIPIWIRVIADITAILASCFIGYGTNIITGGSPNASSGWLAVIPGVLLAIFATAVKYMKS